MPNAAMKPSPCRLPTLAPLPPSTRRTVSPYRLSTRFITSGSSRRPSTVESTTSQNTTVTILNSPEEAGVPRRAPHRVQASPGWAMTFPQVGHLAMT
jgi:hypothetical protein